MGADRDRTRDPPTVKPKVKPSRYEATPEIFIIRYDMARPRQFGGEFVRYSQTNPNIDLVANTDDFEIHGAAL